MFKYQRGLHGKGEEMTDGRTKKKTNKQTKKKTEQEVKGEMEKSPEASSPDLDGRYRRRDGAAF